MTPHNIHAGKNEPRRLKEGAREHPAISSMAAEEAAVMATPDVLRRIAEPNSLITLRPFCMMKQVSRLEG
jgi:hypothetical protein